MTIALGYSLANTSTSAESRFAPKAASTSLLCGPAEESCPLATCDLVSQLFLRVDADDRLPRRCEDGDLLVDVGELDIAVGVVRASFELFAVDAQRIVQLAQRSRPAGCPAPACAKPRQRPIPMLQRRARPNGDLDKRWWRRSRTPSPPTTALPSLGHHGARREIVRPAWQGRSPTTARSICG